jgi:pimeloyl-ACP methyl ester carboxylesterase
MRSLTVDVAGPTHIVDFGGAGKPFLLVHGLGGSTVNWLELGPALTRHGRVIALDLPGFGRTPPAGRRAGIDHQQCFVGRFIDDQLGTPTTLIGNSMGGLVTMLAAARRPEQVERLILINPAAPAPTRIGSIEPTMLLLAAGALLPPLGLLALRSFDRLLDPKQRVTESFANVAADPGRISPEVMRAHVDMTAERRTQSWSHPAFIEAYRSILLRFLPGRLDDVIDAITAPTLLMHGTMDRIVPYEASRRLARLRPDWTFESLRNLGHVPMLEDGPGTGQLIDAWLESRASRAA